MTGAEAIEAEDRKIGAIVEAAAALVRSVNSLTAVEASAVQHADRDRPGDYGDVVRALGYAQDAFLPLLEGEEARAETAAANAPLPVCAPAPRDRARRATWCGATALSDDYREVSCPRCLERIAEAAGAEEVSA